jgi:hypothetical protein
MLNVPACVFVDGYQTDKLLDWSCTSVLLYEQFNFSVCLMARRMIQQLCSLNIFPLHLYLRKVANWYSRNYL